MDRDIEKLRAKREREVEKIRKEWLKISKRHIKYINNYYEHDKNNRKDFIGIMKNLINTEAVFIILDTMFEADGYYSVFNKDIRKIKKEKKIVYKAVDSSDYDLELSFDITEDDLRVGFEKCFWLKITDIKRI